MQEIKDAVVLLVDPGTEPSDGIGHEFHCSVDRLADDGTVVLSPAETWLGDSHFYQDRFRWMIDAAQVDDKDGPGLEGPDLEEWAASWIESQLALLAQALWSVYNDKLELEDPATVAARTQAILARIQG